MAVSLKKLFEPTALTSSNETIYTLDGASTTIIENLVVRLVNHTGTPETVKGYAVPSGGSASVTNQIFSGSVPDADFILVTIPVLKKDDQIVFAQTSGTAVVNIQHESGLPKTP